MLEQEFRDQLGEVLDMADIPVRDLVNPADRTTGVGADAVVADVQKAAIRTGHQRIIVHDAAEGAPDVIHVRDTLLEAADRPVRELSCPAFRLDADTSVLAASQP